MTNEKISLLGFPIDRIPKEKLDEALRHLIEGYYEDLRPRFATTLNALFIGQLFGFCLGNRKAPDVVEILREADLIGLDSAPLQFISKLLGDGVDELITGEDLLLATASFLARHNQSIFLLGGREELSHQAALTLQKDFPGLKIAGISSPSIYTKGERLGESIERDAYIVDSINNAKPTVLVLQLGHPKQEIWFERIREQLKVPLCLGVGSAFERYLRGKNSHFLSPKEPTHVGRIRPRLTSALHYLFWIPPLFLYNTINRLLYDVFHRHKQTPTEPYQLFLSEKESLVLIPLPTFVTCSGQPTWIKEVIEHDNIVLDLAATRHLGLSGIGLIMTVWREALRENKNLYLIGISADIRQLLKLHGVWDLIASYVCKDPDGVLEKMSFNKGVDLKKEREFVSLFQTPTQTTLSFFGRIDGVTSSPQAIRQLPALIGMRHCLVNLKYCTFISNAGFGFLLKLQTYQKEQQKSLKILQANRALRKLFFKTKLGSLFHFG